MPVLTPRAGSIGLPDGVKEAGRRVDFRPDDFVLAIETKGYRLAWSRAMLCPCKPINDQTDQSDPNCPLCTGSGWLRFRPAGAVINQDVTGALDATQLAIIGTDSAVIRGVMTGIANNKIQYDPILARLEGTMMVTCRAENKLGYYDRLVNLDSTIVYSQILKYDNTALTALRYPVRAINSLRSASKTYAESVDFVLAAGKLQWLPGKSPPTNERLSAHYLTHPTWRVVEHPHAARSTAVKYKTKSPTGDPVDLPVQALAKLEFML